MLLQPKHRLQSKETKKSINNKDKLIGQRSSRNKKNNTIHGSH